MKQVTLRERGRIHRVKPGRLPGEDSPDACWLDALLFDRLMTFDRRRGDGAVFDWRIDEGRAGQWVGVIQVPGLLLELLPKIDHTDAESSDPVPMARDNLLVMLAEAGDVPLRARDIASLSTRRAPLHETLVLIFARKLLSELGCGPDRGYVREEDRLLTLRGKLLMSRHVAENAARRDRFTCSFEEFSPDTPLGKVLRATCRVLLNSIRTSESREALSHCLLLLDDVSDVSDPLHWLARVVLSRSNERFSVLLPFCRLVLEQLAPTSSRGGATTFSLLFDMDRVFEGYIAGMLKRASAGADSGIKVYPQARNHRRYLMEGDQGGLLSLKPDLLVKGQNHRLVIDTKWKRLGSLTQRRQAGLSASDLYQLFAYTHRFGVERSILLFPRMAGTVDREFDLLGPDGKPDGSRLYLRHINLHRNLGTRSEKYALMAELMGMIGEGLGAPQGQGSVALGGEG